MKFLYSYVLAIVLFILMIFVQNCFASEKQLLITSAMQYDYGLKLLNEKDYETAIVEFKKFIHFFPDSEQKDQVQFNIGVCLFNLKKYNDAALVFNEIITNSQNHDIVRESYFYQSKAFMNIGNTGYAQLVLQNYLKLVKDKKTINKIYFNLTQIHLENAKKARTGSLALAKTYLLKISESGAKKYNTDQYLDLITKAENMPKKNPKAAGLFAVIPGGGFLYCERYHDAFTTFLLNTGLMYAAYEAFDNGNKALAGVIAFVETGFYTGNIYGSISSAHKYNKAQTISILNKKFFISSKIDLKKKVYELSFNYGF